MLRVSPWQRGSRLQILAMNFPNKFSSKFAQMWSVKLTNFSMARVSLKMSTATAAGFVHSDHLTVQTGYELMCEDTIQQPEVSAPMGEQKLSGTWPWRSLNKRRQFQTKSSRHSTFSIKLQFRFFCRVKITKYHFPFPALFNRECSLPNAVFLSGLDAISATTSGRAIADCVRTALARVDGTNSRGASLLEKIQWYRHGTALDWRRTEIYFEISDAQLSQSESKLVLQPFVCQCALRTDAAEAW